jgi:hypothetical protein
MTQLRSAMEGARADAADAALMLDHALRALSELVNQAQGREHVTRALRGAIEHVIAAGIRAETASSHTQVAIELLGGEITPEPLRFARYIAQPGGGIQA